MCFCLRMAYMVSCTVTGEAICVRTDDGEHKNQHLMQSNVYE